MQKKTSQKLKNTLPIFLNNVLLEEFIGNNKPAFKIKDYLPRAKKAFFEKIISGVKKMYNAGMVHADLSQFNILIHNFNPVFIDFSQGTVTQNNHAKELLERDIKNVVNFFNKRGLKIDKTKVKKEIIGKV